MLETLGVPVIGYGTDEFPGFYYANTGLDLSHKVTTPQETAKAIAAYRATGYRGTILITQPPPEPLSREYVESMLEKAGKDEPAGQARTPVLLKRLAALSDGQTVAVNLKLLRANAALAGRVACALGALTQSA